MAFGMPFMAHTARLTSSSEAEGKEFLTITYFEPILHKIVAK